MSTIEKRFLPFAQAELRIDKATPGQLPKIVGYAAVYNTLSAPLGGGYFRETIRAGCFSLCLEKNPDVRALIDHDPSKILGRTKSGTLSLLNTQKGLRAEIQPGDTTAGRDAVESLGRGDIDGMSFGFTTIKDEWSERVIEGKLTFIRELVEVDVFDVSIATYPAYPDTEVSIRSLEAWKKLSGKGYVPDLDLLRRRLRLAEV